MSFPYRAALLTSLFCFMSLVGCGLFFGPFKGLNEANCNNNPAVCGSGEQCNTTTGACIAASDNDLGPAGMDMALTDLDQAAPQPVSTVDSWYWENPLPHGVSPQSVWGTDANNVWAIGAAGTILKWNGTAWAAQTSGTGQQLFAVGGVDAGNVWAVGSSGTILKWNGTAWAAQTSGTNQNLVSIWGTAANSMWAVGVTGVLLKWDGTAWTAQNSGTANALNDIFGLTDNNIWTVGQNGTILHKSQ